MTAPTVRRPACVCSHQITAIIESMIYYNVFINKRMENDEDAFFLCFYNGQDFCWYFFREFYYYFFYQKPTRVTTAHVLRQMEGKKCRQKTCSPRNAARAAARVPSTRPLLGNRGYDTVVFFLFILHNFNARSRETRRGTVNAVDTIRLRSILSE